MIWSVWYDSYKLSSSYGQSICICYYLFISKDRNLEKFNCPIPPEYYYSIELDDGQRIEVTTETFYYSAFQLRQGLVLVIIITQSILILGSILLWKFVGLSEKSWVSTSSTFRLKSLIFRIMLLQGLPIIDESIRKGLIQSETYTDLALIMDLVAVNKINSKYIRLAFEIMDTVNSKRTRKSFNAGFFRAFRELAVWHVNSGRFSNGWLKACFLLA